MTCARCLLAYCTGMLVSAQIAGAQDTLQLRHLQEEALRTDPRTSEIELLRAATDLRLSALGSERLPQVGLNAWASHQSDITNPSLNIPGAVFPELPRNRWQSTVDVTQLVYDGGTLSRRRELERARYDESAAAVNVALYGLRSEVNAAFFSAFLLQQRSSEYDALVMDLDARLRAVRARVEAGTALGRDAAEVEAERVRAMLQRDEARATRRASLAILADLVGRPIDTAAVLVLPNAEPAEGQRLTVSASASLRLRPEFEQFRRTRSRLDRELALTGSENAPRLSAFGQAGVGRPGLNQFRTTSDAFWQAGLKLEWHPWTWNSAGRNAAALRFQQQVVEREEHALARSLARQAITDREDIDRLTASLSQDERVVTLRTEIERQARAQHDEGTITTAEYVDTRTDVLEARLALQRHRVELAQARARYQTTLGFVPREGAQP